MDLTFKFPNFKGILKTLNNAKISVSNPALYQTIKSLIDKSAQLEILNENVKEALSQFNFGPQGELIINIGVIGPFTSKQLADLCVDETGSAGHLVFSDSPNLETYFTIDAILRIKQDTGEFQIRLADDSAFAPLQASIITAALRFFSSPTGLTFPAGASAHHTIAAQGAGDAGGTTDITGLDTRIQLTGNNNVATSYGFRGANVNAAGAGTLTTQIGFEGLNSITGAGAVTNGRVFQARTAHSGAGNLTGSLIYYETSPGAPSGAGDYVGTIFGHLVRNIGRAAATVITGYDVLDLTKGSGDVYGYRGRIASASGKYNLFMDGTAQNHLRGNLGIGSGKTAPAYSIDSAGQINGLSYGCGVITTTATGAQNDFVINANGELRCNNATDLTITGIVAGIAGQRLRIISIGAGNVFLAHLNGGSVAANQLFNITRSANTPLAAGSGVAEYEYDATSAVWRLVSHVQGAVITPTFAAGEYTGNGAMTWTVVAGDVLTMGYMLSGRQLTVFFEVNATTTIGGVANTTLIKTIPGGFTTNRQSQQPCIVSDPGVGALGFGKCFVTAGGTNLNFRAGAAAPVWGAGATAGMNGVVNCEVQ